MSTFWYLFIGLIAGILGGAFGIGGGAFMVPVLIIFMQVNTHVAIGTSLAAIVAISIAGTWRHFTLGNLEAKIALLMSLSGFIGSILGASLVEKLPAIYARRALAVFLIYSAIRLWWSK